MMGFDVFCGTLIALLFGLAICFGGYRMFLILLPIWGFFFGFVLGAETLQALFGIGFLATVTSWVIGLFAGVLFAVLSYLFYMVGVVILAGSLGYMLGAGFMHLIGIDLGFLVWIIAMVVAVVLAIVTIRFNLQKYVIVIATALGGAGTMVATLVLGITGASLARLITNPVQLILKNSWWWTLVFLVLAVAGIVIQLRSTREWELEPYDNRI
jgi:hypothetical protein